MDKDTIVSEDRPRLVRMGDNKEVFIIPSLTMDNPDCEVLFEVADCLDEIVCELREIAKDKI